MKKKAIVWDVWDRICCDCRHNDMCPRQHPLLEDCLDYASPESEEELEIKWKEFEL